MKSNSNRKRRKKIIYGLQITWIVSAIIATIVLLVAGNKLLGIDKTSEAISQGTVSANESEETIGKDDETALEENGQTNEDPSEEASGELEGTDQEENPDSEQQQTPEAAPTEGETKEESGIEGADSEEIQPDVENGLEGGNIKEEETTQESVSEDMQAIIEKNQIDVNKPMVAFTFDDGPYPKVTNRILQALSDNGGRATFFVMGNRMDSYGDTVEKAYEQGNQIGNHTYSHKDLTKITIEELQYEVGHACELIQQHAAESQVVLRPPYGNKNDTVSENLTVPMIAWSLDTEDWKSRDAKSVIQNVLSTVKDGDIILMHDLYESTAEAVEYLVPELIKQGYQLVTIDELFAAKGYALEAGKVYHNGRGQ